MRTPPPAMPALVTPFDDSGDLRIDDHAHNIATLSAAGAAGFLIGGSTGEGPYLEPGERSRLVTTARELAPDAYLLCGIAGQSVRQAIAQIEEAFAAGADAALALTPASLVLGNDGAVIRFYRSVAAASPLPVLLYTLERVTGYVLGVASVMELAHEASIVGIKDSNGAPERMQAVRAGLGETPFLMYAGASRVLAASMAAGTTGAITASSSYAFGLRRRHLHGICRGSRPRTSCAAGPHRRDRSARATGNQSRRKRVRSACRSPSGAPRSPPGDRIRRGRNGARSPSSMKGCPQPSPRKAGLAKPLDPRRGGCCGV